MQPVIIFAAYIACCSLGNESDVCYLDMNVFFWTTSFLVWWKALQIFTS
jgi:hypothetical protein